MEDHRYTLAPLIIGSCATDDRAKTLLQSACCSTSALLSSLFLYLLLISDQQEDPLDSRKWLLFISNSLCLQTLDNQQRRAHCRLPLRPRPIRIRPIDRQQWRRSSRVEPKLKLNPIGRRRYRCCVCVAGELPSTTARTEVKVKVRFTHTHTHIQEQQWRHCVASNFTSGGSLH